MMLNLPAVPDTLMMNRIPNALTRSRYILPSRSYVDAYLPSAQTTHTNWLAGVTVRASDLRSSGCGFDSRSGRYQAT